MGADLANPPELRHPFSLAETMAAQLVEDITQIVQRVRYIEVAPAHMWSPALVSELADAADRLSAKVGKLQEAGGDR